MRHRAQQTAAVISAGLLLWLGLVAGPVPGAVATPGPVTVGQAQDRVAAAERALERAQARKREACGVLAQTRLYTSLYGPQVGRWVLAARRAGWTWGELPTLMLVVDRESGGNPAALSPDGYYAGLMQFGMPWWDGKWNPFDGYTSLYRARRAHDASGWQHWPWVQ